MKRNVFSFMLALLAVGAMLVTGCKKYDDDISDVNKRIDAIDTDLSSVRSDLSATSTKLEGEIKTLEESVTSLTGGLAAVAVVAGDAKETADEALEMTEELTGAIAELERAKAEKTVVDELQAKIDSIAGLTPGLIDTTKLIGALAQIRGKIQAVETGYKAADAVLYLLIQNLSDDLDDIDTTVAGIITRVSELETGLKLQQTTIDNTREALKKLQDDLNSNIAAVNKRIDDVSAELSNANGNITALQKAMADVNKAIGDINSALKSKEQEFRDEVDKIYEDIDGLNTSIEELKETVAGHTQEIAALWEALKLVVPELGGVMEALDKKADKDEFNAAIKSLESSINNCLNEAKSYTNDQINYLRDEVSENLAKAVAGLKNDIKTALKSVAFIPDTMFDGLGVITFDKLFWMKTAKGSSTSSLVTSSPAYLKYRLNPGNASLDSLSYDFITRSAYTKANGDDDDCISIDKVERSQGYSDEITVTARYHWMKTEFSHGKRNTLAALRLTTDNGGDCITSDYSYVQALQDVDDEHYVLAHLDALDKKLIYRGQTIDIDAQCDDSLFWDSGYHKLQPALKYNGVLDLSEYVTACVADTFSSPHTWGGQLSKALGVPESDITYTYKFASTNGYVSEDPDRAKYVGKDGVTNQNKFVKLNVDGVAGRMMVNTDFVAQEAAIGRTPQIYVEASYDKHYVASSYIKVRIVRETVKPADENLYHKIYMAHNVNFTYENIPENAGISYDMDKPNEKLEVDWTEFNQKVLSVLKCSFEDFQKNYWVAADSVMVVVDSTTSPTTGKTSYTYEKASDALPTSWVNAVPNDPTEWQTSSNIIALMVGPRGNVPAPVTRQYILIYPAKDNKLHEHVAVNFTFDVSTPKPHEHQFIIEDMQLNPDYLLGPKNVLNTTNSRPKDDYNPAGENPAYSIYAGVKVKGRDTSEHKFNSAVIEHFKDYKINPLEHNGTTLKFKIENFKADKFAFVPGDGLSAGTITTESGYSVLTLTKASIDSLNKGLRSSADVKLMQDLFFGTNANVLVSVTETCDNPRATTRSKTGFYYVVYNTINLKAIVDPCDLYDIQGADSVEFQTLVHFVDANNESEDMFVFDAPSDSWVATQYAIDTYGAAIASHVPTVWIKSNSRSQAITYDTSKYPGDDQASFGGYLRIGNDNPYRYVIWQNLGTRLIRDKRADLNLEYVIDGNASVMPISTITVHKTN